MQSWILVKMKGQEQMEWPQQGCPRMLLKSWLPHYTLWPRRSTKQHLPRFLSTK